jgi:hypothetical protein
MGQIPRSLKPVVTMVNPLWLCPGCQAACCHMLWDAREITRWHQRLPCRPDSNSRFLPHLMDLTTPRRADLITTVTASLVVHRLVVRGSEPHACCACVLFCVQIDVAMSPMQSGPSNCNRGELVQGTPVWVGGSASHHCYSIHSASTPALNGNACLCSARLVSFNFSPLRTSS